MAQREDDWEAGLTAAVAAQIKYWRGLRGMSAQQLADRCAEVGREVTRLTITNLENHRRGTITLGELLALAGALAVPPVALMLPLGNAASAEVLPGKSVPVQDALSWVQGQSADGLPVPFERSASLIALLRQHERAEEDLLVAIAAADAEGWDRSSPDRWRRVHESQMRRAEAIERLRDVRIALRTFGFVPPHVPSRIATWVDLDQPEVIAAQLRSAAGSHEHQLRQMMKLISDNHGTNAGFHWSSYGTAEDAHHNLLSVRQQLRELGQDPPALPADLSWAEKWPPRPADVVRLGPDDLSPGFRPGEPLAWEREGES